MERCRKPLYLASDWFVHLPMKYLVNGKNKQRELITAMEIERGINRGSTMSAGLGYSNRSNIQVRTNGMGRLNDFFYLI